jgi:hypothetical protein
MGIYARDTFGERLSSSITHGSKVDDSKGNDESDEGIAVFGHGFRFK